MIRTYFAEGVSEQGARKKVFSIKDGVRRVKTMPEFHDIGISTE